MKTSAILLALLAALSGSAPLSARQDSGIKIPAEIPIFPLPETSLIADALKGDLIIGMVRLRPGFAKDYEGRPPIYSIGCAGVIVNDDERVTLSALRNRVEKLLDAVLALTAEPPDPALDDAEFVNIVAQNLGMPESARQELLERNRVVERARALVEILEQQ